MKGGALHAVQPKQKSKTKRKKKIADAIYEYQTDCNGKRGEIALDFEGNSRRTNPSTKWKEMMFSSVLIQYIIFSDAMCTNINIILSKIVAHVLPFEVSELCTLKHRLGFTRSNGIILFLTDPTVGKELCQLFLHSLLVVWWYLRRSRQ